MNMEEINEHCPHCQTPSENWRESPCCDGAELELLRERSEALAFAVGRFISRTRQHPFSERSLNLALGEFRR